MSKGRRMKVILTGLVMLSLLVVAVGIAFSDDEFNPPGVPTPEPISSGGGGGGGGGGSYTPPAFQTYTKPLKSSDGTVIGRFEGKDFNSVMVWAEKNGTVSNVSYDLTVEGELSSQPPDSCWLDINFLEPGALKVPPGMENGLVIGVINVTKNPNDWSYKSGSPKYTLKVSGLAQNINPDDPYYMIQWDGANYQVQKISIDVSEGQASIKFNPPGDTGVFTVIGAPIVTPTPTPTPTPVPTPTPMPLPPDNGIWGIPIFIAMFAVGAIVGAVSIFIVMRNR